MRTLHTIVNAAPMSACATMRVQLLRTDYGGARAATAIFASAPLVLSSSALALAARAETTEVNYEGDVADGHQEIL